MSGIALLEMQYADVVLGELHHPTTHRNAFDHSAAVAGIVASLAYEQDEIDANVMVATGWLQLAMDVGGCAMGEAPR